jgi:hypothetical protein
MLVLNREWCRKAIESVGLLAKLSRLVCQGIIKLLATSLSSLASSIVGKIDDPVL